MEEVIVVAVTWGGVWSFMWKAIAIGLIPATIGFFIGLALMASGN